MLSTLTVGQAVQPSILSEVERTVKNLKGWLHANSASFSAIAGEQVSRLDVVKAHLYLAFVAFVMFIVSNMGGGNIMSMTYEEYSGKILAIEEKMSASRENQKREATARDMELEKELAMQTAEYYNARKKLTAVCDEDCEVIRNRYKQERVALHGEREKLIAEWRVDHPIPAALINKAAEMMRKEGGEV